MDFYVITQQWKIQKTCTTQSNMENAVTVGQLWSLQCIMFQQDHQSWALALNHSDAAAREEQLYGILPHFIVILCASQWAS